MKKKTPAHSALVPDTHNRDYPMYDWPTRHRAMAGAIVPLLEDWLGVANGVPIDLWPHRALTPWRTCAARSAW